MHAAVHGVEAAKKSLGAAVFAYIDGALLLAATASVVLLHALCRGGLLMRQTRARGGKR